MKSKKANSIKKRLEYIKDPLQLTAQLHDARIVAEFEIRMLTNIEQQILREYLVSHRRWRGWVKGQKIPTIETVPKSKCICLFLGGSFALLLEIGLALWLSPSAFNLPTELALTGGLLLALAFASISKAVFLGILYDQNNPVLWQSRFKFVAGISALISTITLSPVIFGRSVPEIASITGIAIGIAGIALPICAGALFTLAFLVGWQFWICKKYRKVKREQLEWQRLLIYLIRQLKENRNA